MKKLHRKFIRKNFANLDPEDLAERGRMGGIISQKSGNAHKLTPEERSRGGKKGGSR